MSLQSIAVESLPSLMEMGRQLETLEYAENCQEENACIPGFGEYDETVSTRLFKASSKAHALGLMILFATLGTAALIASIAVILVEGALISTGSALLAATVFLSLALKSCLDYLSLRKGPSTTTLGLNAFDHGSLPLGSFSNPVNRGVVCEDSTKSTEWKLRLIDQAQDSIILSGSFCGGDVFDQCLQKIDSKMREKEHLTAIILSSEMFLTDSNRRKIDELASTYPDRFTLVQTPRVVHVDPGIKFSTNHAKALVVDQRYVLIGGSAFDDKNAIWRGDSSPDRLDEPPASCLDQMLAIAFRDMDFVLHCPESNGFSKTLHLELLKLASRWKYYTEEHWDIERFAVSSSAPNTICEAEGIDIFSGEPYVDSISCKVFTTGPEHTSNPFLIELIGQIDRSQESIYIDHLYFHPPQELLLALLGASRRGVKIHIVTNGNDRQMSPSSHSFFAAKSLYHYRYLLQNGNPDHLSYHEYSVEGVTLHKKIIVIDQQLVVAGSGNCGYKSMNMFDYELNILMSSAELARRTIEVIQRDIELSRTVQIDSSERSAIPIGLRIKAGVQSVLSPLIG